MSEFDQAAWRRAQGQLAAANRRFAKKQAAGRRRGGGAGRLLKFCGGRSTRGQGSYSKAGKTVSFLYKKHKGSKNGDRYAESSKNAKFICSSMLGRNAAERDAEWLLDCALHPRVAPDRLINHSTISRPPGRPLTTEEWAKYIEVFIEEIGAKGTNYVAIQHQDTNNDHAHLIYSRALPSGKLLSDSNDFWKCRAAALEAGRKLGLLVEDYHVDAERAPTPTSDRMVSAQRRAARRGTPDGFIDPQVIHRVLTQASTPKAFAAGLTAAGINIKQADKNKNGKVTGILFQKTGADEWLAGSSIDRSFSLPKIQAQIELNRLALLKKEQELLMQRQQQSQSHQTAEREQRYERDL